MNCAIDNGGSSLSASDPEVSMSFMFIASRTSSPQCGHVEDRILEFAGHRISYGAGGIAVASVLLSSLTGWVWYCYFEGMM